MISGGPTTAGTLRNSRKAYAREVMSIVGEPSKRSKSEMTLEFGDPDLEGLKFPQDGPLVITPIIGNCPIMRVLVDNGASVDILFHDTIIRMGYNDSQLTPSDAPIYGFNHVECKVEGAIQLPVTIGEEPMEATQMLNFQVFKEASTYNAIMGYTGIHAFKAVPLTYHMVLKFPTRNGVGEARGDQKMARNCYIAALRPDGTGGQVLPIEDMDVQENDKLRGKPAEDLVPIPLAPLDPEKVTYIGTSLDKPLKGRMTTFLQKNNDNAGSTYQRLVNKIFAHLIGKTMEVYIDIMLVKSLSKADHISHLREVFEVLRHHKIMLNLAKCAFGIRSEFFFGHMVSKRGIEANPNKIKAILNMEPPRSIKDVQKMIGRIAALGRFISKSKDICLPFFKTLKKVKDFEWKVESQEAFEQLKKYMTEDPLLAKPSPEDTLYLYSRYLNKP
ncbi:uncharacterized protein LOC141685768 [Apium graveolens]|uniref:uncharacterized protein LOC141685768 n=1 Tax=Apium graveolens TaxID=4045 RepID=UPI003D7B2FD2